MSLKNGGNVPFPVFGTIPAADVHMAQLPAGSITELPGAADKFAYGGQSGFRLDAGYFLDGAHAWSVEASGFDLAPGVQRFSARSNGSDVIGPTFMDPVAGEQVILDFGIPTARTGAVASEMDNHLWGLETNVRYQIPAIFFADRLDLIGGLRYVQFNENFNLAGGHVAINGFDDPVASAVYYQDNFGVRNNFYGPQIGLASHSDIGKCFTLDVIGKLALGVTDEIATIDGATTLVNPKLRPARR